MTFSKGSTYVAVVPLTNSFGLYQIPEPEPEPGQLTPINLVFQWCLMFDTKLKLRYLLSDLKILTQKIRVSSSVTNNDQLILVDPVDDEDVEDSSTDWSSKRLTMCDLKKRKNVIHSSWSNRSSLYIGYGKYF
jgi:hypothetical protein